MNDVVSESREFVKKLLGEKLAPWVYYHDFRHTEETVEAAREIGAASGLTDEQMEILLLAAWFHDTGYTEVAAGHEDRSVVIAAAYLSGRRYPEEKLRKISGCIMATKVPQRPNNLLEQVICDADMLFLGRKEFFRKNDLLKEEIEKREERSIPAADWLKRSIEFLSKHVYHTPYCREKLSGGVRDNIETMREQLKRLS
jgi:predicted metal-dependent HD superfamily phosphohydrolase